jgi:hypothetical protein
LTHVSDEYSFGIADRAPDRYPETFAGQGSQSTGIFPQHILRTISGRVESVVKLPSIRGAERHP